MIKLQYRGKIIGYNQRYCKGYILSTQYRNFKKIIQFEFIKKYPKFKTLLGDLISELNYNSNHDIDNCTKAIHDALEGYAFLNDRQIKELHVFKNKNIEKGFIIKIYNLTKL